MSTFQKIIKACAIALAVFIIFTIASAIIGAIAGIATTSYIFDNITDNTNRISIEETFDIEKVKNLKLESGAENIKICNGDSNEIRVVANNVPEGFIYEINNDTLNLKSNKKNIRFYNNHESEIILYVPEEFVFYDIEIDLGAGVTDIESLKAEKVDIETGAGEVKINYLEATKKADISCGVGAFNLYDSIINDLDFDAGVGEINLASCLSGKCKIESGVGEINIKLKDFVEETSTIISEKGIGEINVNGREIPNRQKIGNGNDNVIEIEGGVGQINIEY